MTRIRAVPTCILYFHVSLSVNRLHVKTRLLLLSTPQACNLCFAAHSVLYVYAATYQWISGLLNTSCGYFSNTHSHSQMDRRALQL